MITQEELEQTFLRLYSVLESNGFNDLSVRLVFDEEAGLNKLGEESDRNFAYCDFNGAGETMTIAVASKILDQSKHRLNGILSHEFGHVINFYKGKLDHSEREADLAAESIFNRSIYYDAGDVQNDQHGMRPRPAYLDSTSDNKCGKKGHSVSKKHRDHA